MTYGLESWSDCRGFLSDRSPRGCRCEMWSCRDMAVPSETSLRRYITGVSSMTSITHYESVTLLALVLRIWRSWLSPRLSLNCIVFTAVRSKLPSVCPMFSLLSTKEIPSGLKFWGWTWLCLLTSQSLQLLVSSLSLPLPYRDQWYQSIILRPIPQAIVDFRCNSSSLLSSC